jgi:Type ISP C-terminal specificity domain
VYPIGLGLDRIETASFLRSNGTFQYLTGLPGFPDPRTLRRFLLNAPPSVWEHLHRANDQLLQKFIHLPHRRSRGNPLSSNGWQKAFSPRSLSSPLGRQRKMTIFTPDSSMTAFTEESPTNGPAVTLTGLIPDLHHYKGSFGGRVFPLWRNRDASVPNMPANLLTFLARKYGFEVNAEDLVAYIAAIAAHPGFTARFQEDLSTPGLRIPLTSDRDTFAETADLGRTIIWLHTFGERLTDPQKGRLAQPPRLPPARMPRIPAAGAIPQEPSAMPDSINYDASKKRLLVGQGYVENVEPAVWLYEVSGKQVLLQWFSYRKANRERPIIGDRRIPSTLGRIQPDHWLAEYTTELINVLNVLGWLVDLEPAQAALLEKACAGPTISLEELRSARALQGPTQPKRGGPKSFGPGLFDAAYA